MLVNDSYDHRSKFTKQFWTLDIYNATSVAAKLSLKWPPLFLISTNSSFKSINFCRILAEELSPSYFMILSNFCTLESTESTKILNSVFLGPFYF